MKKSITLLLALLSNLTFAQNSYYLEMNNVKARLSDNGVFFSDQANYSADYEFPKGSNKYCAYSMSFWVAGLDQNNTLHVAAQQYGIQNDMFSGPVSDDYNSSYYQNNFLNSIWVITKSEVDTHISSWSNPGYTIPQSILNWPGNGNVSEGVAEQLAPYVDINNNQIYDPAQGDYPVMQGDITTYIILNDDAGPHAQSGGAPLGIEIHCMFYEYVTADELNNTIFLNAKLINRSSEDYHDVHFGVYMDADIGLGSNDYVGCDSIKNLAYAYNGVSADPGGAGQSAYGNEPPAFGVKILNKNMSSFLYMNIGTGLQGDPVTPADYYSYLSGTWKDGSQVSYGGNGTGSSPYTNYCYSGNPGMGTGWTEVGVANPPGDRRFIMSMEKEDIVAGSSSCYDMAFIVNMDDPDYLANTNNLIVTGDFIQSFYDANILTCDSFTSSISENELGSFTIYPNPSNGSFTVQSNEAFEFSIQDLNGKLVQAGQGFEGNNYLEMEVEKGIYLIQIKTENSIETRKIEILK